jgi:hypothetical protein
MKRENMKWVKGAKVEDLEGAFVIWIQLFSAKSGTTVNDIKEQMVFNWTVGMCDRYCTQEHVCILLKNMRV